MVISIWALFLLTMPPQSGAETRTESLADASLDVTKIIDQLYVADDLRNVQMEHYTSIRKYTAENKRFKKHAEVEVAECYSATAGKQFVTLSESGSRIIRNRVIHKLIDTESEAFTSNIRQQTRFSHENYHFRLLGTEEIEGRPAFVLEVKPKQKEKYLVEGKIWVDQNDFAITKIEGRPAKKPSFWTRSVFFVRRYGKIAGLWLPVLTSSESNVLIAGKSTLEVQYDNYTVQTSQQKEVATSVSCQVQREGI